MSNFSKSSSPTDLKITDMRIAVVGENNWRWPIIKLYTNQDIVGLGEVRDGASARYALMLKSRLIGENPCDVERLFKKIKQFGGHGRLGGGVCGVEMALMDLAGKAYGVPAYMLAGGKYRDQVRVYSDTPSKKDPVEMGNALKERMERGFSYLNEQQLLKQLPAILIVKIWHWLTRAGNCVAKIGTGLTSECGCWGRGLMHKRM